MREKTQIKDYIKKFLKRKDIEYNSFLDNVSAKQVETLLQNKAFEAICMQVVSNSLQNIIVQDNDSILEHKYAVNTITSMQTILRNHLYKKVNEEENK